MTNINTSNLLAMRKAIIEQNNVLKQAAQSPSETGAVESSRATFGAQMRDAVSQVNELQQQSATAQTAYTMGETTDIAAVMLAKQKASVGFEATLQVRNKLLSAYKDIMNMPV